MRSDHNDFARGAVGSNLCDRGSGMGLLTCPVAGAALRGGGGAGGERDEASTAMGAFGRGGVAGGSCFGGLAVVGDGKVVVIPICGGAGNGTEELLGAQQAGVDVAESEETVVAGLETGAGGHAGGIGG
jgi:hypothetical protein